MEYNIDFGFVDGILRGYRLGLLTSVQYTSLTQCENLEGKFPTNIVQLLATDYAQFFQQTAEEETMSTSLIHRKLLTSFADQFRYLRGQASEPLMTFLDYITYSYMIDNVVVLITGSLHERETHELMEKCHPLGTFEGMGALTAASTPAELYNLVLVATPLAQDLDDINIEIIRNSLYKSYLEDFQEYCAILGGSTFDLMSEMLVLDADRRMIDITINSFGTELNKNERLGLYPTIGKLYPDGAFRLAQADDLDQVKSIVSKYPSMVEEGTFNDKSMDDRFLEAEVNLAKKAFQIQFHFAHFYAYAKLKEQEIRNLVWIAECIAQRQKDKISKFIVIYQ